MALKGRGQWLNPLIFFVMVSALFPLSSMHNPLIYKMLAPSIIWVAFLLATVLSLEFSFKCDFEEGIFEQWVLSCEPLWFLLLIKGLAHWLVHLFPMVLIAPFVGYSLHLGSDRLIVLMVSLLLGTPALSMIALMGVGLTVGLKNSGILLSLILFPLTLPILIFGVGAVQSVHPQAQLALLGAFLALGISLAPLGAAFALKTSLS